MTREKLIEAIEHVRERLLFAIREIDRENDEAAAAEIEAAATGLAESMKELRG